MAARRLVGSRLTSSEESKEQIFQCERKSRDQDQNWIQQKHALLLAVEVWSQMERTTEPQPSRGADQLTLLQQTRKASLCGCQCSARGIPFCFQAPGPSGSLF